MEALIPPHHSNPVVVLRKIHPIPWQHRNPRVVLEVYEEPPQPVLKKQKTRKRKVVMDVPSKSFLAMKTEVWKEYFPEYNDENIIVIVTELWQRLTKEEKELYIEFD